MPFRDVRGHRRLVELLSRSIHRGTLPPSLIFAGSQTRDVAIAVAQALNCQSPIESRIPSPESQTPSAESRIPNPESRDACGHCPACVRIARGVHPDVLVVEPGDNGNIRLRRTPGDSARFVIEEVIESTGFKPFEGRRRVTIIDEADAMVREAQNALLKTLEEPPPSSVFILLTAKPDLLLATVRSRCIRLTFAGAADAEVDEDAREAAQRLLLQAASVKDPARRIEVAKELHPRTSDTGAAGREHVARHLRAMASLLRDAEIVATRADAPLANGEASAGVERLAAAYGADRGVRAFEAIDRALSALDGNAGAKTVADWVMLQL